jgi:hypothetical protein
MNGIVILETDHLNGLSWDIPWMSGVAMAPWSGRADQKRWPWPVR